MQETGPIPIIKGSTPPVPVATISTNGFKLYFLTASSDANIKNEAPSLSPEAFPAVTEPSFLKAGFNLANFSASVFLFGYSSVSNVISPFY